MPLTGRIDRRRIPKTTDSLALIKRIGASRAAYSSVLFPVVALVVSTIFESYRWSLPAAIGLAVLVAGNALALGGVRRRAA